MARTSALVTAVYWHFIEKKACAEKVVVKVYFEDYNGANTV